MWSSYLILCIMYLYTGSLNGNRPERSAKRMAPLLQMTVFLLVLYFFDNLGYDKVQQAAVRENKIKVKIKLYKKVRNFTKKITNV